MNTEMRHKLHRKCSTTIDFPNAFLILPWLYAALSCNIAPLGGVKSSLSFWPFWNRITGMLGLSPNAVRMFFMQFALCIFLFASNSSPVMALKTDTHTVAMAKTHEVSKN